VPLILSYPPSLLVQLPHMKIVKFSPLRLSLIQLESSPISSTYSTCTHASDQLLSLDGETFTSFLLFLTPPSSASFHPETQDSSISPRLYLLSSWLPK
jgi:hypothetical protein